MKIYFTSTICKVYVQTITLQVYKKLSTYICSNHYFNSYIKSVASEYSLAISKKHLVFSLCQKAPMSKNIEMLAAIQEHQHIA